jgi:hypothetical protein
MRFPWLLCPSRQHKCPDYSKSFFIFFAPSNFLVIICLSFIFHFVDTCILIMTVIKHTYTCTHTYALCGRQLIIFSPKTIFYSQKPIVSTQALNKPAHIPANRLIHMEKVSWEKNLCSQISPSGALPVNINISPPGS